jgi:hypothetical protein
MSDEKLASIFSRSVSLHMMIASMPLQKLSSLMQSLWSIIAFASCVFGVLSRKKHGLCQFLEVFPL